MSKTIIVGVLVALVILTEGLFAWFLIPSTADVEAWAESKAKAEHAAEAEHAADEHVAGEHAKAGEHGEAGHGHADQEHAAPHGSKSAHGGGHEHEVDLGKFNIVVHQPMSQVTVRVNFHLIGTVGEKDHEQFETLLAKNQHRLRDNVIFEVRNCQPDDLLDPGLALLKRRILAKSNDLLGQPLLHSIVFSDFAYLDQ